MACVEEEDDFFVEPLLYDEAKLFARMDAAREARLRAEEEQARKDEERRRRGAVHQAVLNSILERDPKTGREVYTRYSFTDFSKFDINEESLIPPMRFTNTGYLRGLNLEDSANILSVKIVSSDGGFPINVYGTIIARDSIDHKCIYIFNRHREDYQTINSEVSYATILNAVEGTFEIEMLEGHFFGEIRVGIEGIEEKIVIHNSKEDGVVTFSGDRTVVTLKRRVLTICLGRMLTFEFVSKGCCLCGGVSDPNATSEGRVEFAPQRHGQEISKVSCGACKLLVKVVWSMMDIFGRSPVA